MSAQFLAWINSLSLPLLINDLYYMYTRCYPKVPSPTLGSENETKYWHVAIDGASYMPNEYVWQIWTRAGSRRYYKICSIYWNLPGTRFIGFVLDSCWVQGADPSSENWVRATLLLFDLLKIFIKFLSNCEKWIVNRQFSGIMDYGDYAIIEGGTSILPPFTFLKELFEIKDAPNLSGKPKTQT